MTSGNLRADQRPAPPIHSQDGPSGASPLVGEVLTYRVDYLHVPAAEFSMHIDEVVDIRGHPAYHLVVEGHTTSLVAKLFFANNRYESFFDIAEGYSLQLAKAVRQKNIEQDVVITFDPMAGVATDGRTRWSIPPRVHDVFSMLYFLRRQRLHAGDEIVFTVDGEGKLCQGTAKVMGRRSLDSPWGRRGAIRVRLQFRDCEQRAVLFPKTDILTNRLMNLQRDLTVWFTNDSLRVPILIEYVGRLASAKARLIDAHIPGLEMKSTTLRPHDIGP